MNIKPVAGPNSVAPVLQTSNNTPARANAIKAFMGGQEAAPSAPAPQQQMPVRNANQVSAEELSAIRQPSAPMEETLTPPDVPQSNAQPEETAETKDPALSRQFAQLARQERQLRQKQAQLDQAAKAREAALAEREAQIAAREQETRDGYISKDLLKKQTLRTLIDNGVSYEDLTQQILDSSNPLDPRIDAHLQKQSAEIERLQKIIDERESKAQQSQQNQYDAAVKQIRNDVTALVKADPNFESIRATRSHNDVVDLIVKTFEEDGYLMPVEEAASEVENYLVEEAFKLSRLSKVQKRLQANAKPAAPSQTQQSQKAQAQAQSKPTMKTLTNATGSTRPLSARERAVLAFRGELK